MQLAQARARQALKDTPDNQKDAIEAELNKLEKEVFKEHSEVIAAAEILLALSEEFQFEQKQKQLTFMVDSHFAFVIGHIITEIGLE